MYRMKNFCKQTYEYEIIRSNKVNVIALLIYDIDTRNAINFKLKDQDSAFSCNFCNNPRKVYEPFGSLNTIAFKLSSFQFVSLFILFGHQCLNNEQNKSRNKLKVRKLKSNSYLEFTRNEEELNKSQAGKHNRSV